jgi:hypothetical protein
MLLLLLLSLSRTLKVIQVTMSYSENQMLMLIFQKTDAYFVLHIILIISVIITISHNKLQSVSAWSNYQVHPTPLGAKRSLWLNRLDHLPLSDRTRLYNTYYSYFDAAKNFHNAERPSLLHSLGRVYAASYGEYSVASVSLHHCAKLVIWINILSQFSPTLLLEGKLAHFSHYETHLHSERKKNRNCK